MPISDQGLSLLEQRESCVLTPYQDTQGVWTDGYGNIHGVIPHGPPITQEKAEEDLKRNLAWVYGALNGVTVLLKTYQYDALCSFIFNVGAGAWSSSTMLRLINEGDMDGAAAQFDRWHVPPEITSRRNGEREQFKGTAFEARIP